MIRGGSWQTRKDAAELVEWIYGLVAMAKGVTAINRPTPESLEIRSEHTPGWAIVLAILCFPIGLLLLLAKNRAVMLVRVSPEPDGGSTVTVSGGGSPTLDKAMNYVYESTVSPASALAARP